MKNNIRIVGDIVDVLNLRSYIIFCEEEELNELCDTDEKFIYLLYDLVKLLSIDDGDFVLLNDDITNKVYKLINLRRFEIRKKYPEEYNLANELIICLNKLNSIDEEEKKDIRMRYFFDQAKKRRLLYTNYQSFIDSMGVDSFVLDSLNGEEIPEDIPKEFIIGSVNYLSRTMPNLFQVETVRDRFEEILDDVKSKSNDILFNKKTNKIKKMILKR